MTILPESYSTAGVLCFLSAVMGLQMHDEERRFTETEDKMYSVGTQMIFL